MNFRADRELIREANSHCSLTRTKTQEPSEVVGDRSVRLQHALAYLAEQPVMRVRTYAAITGLSPNASSRELRSFYQEGKLDTIGVASHLRYILPKAEGE